MSEPENEKKFSKFQWFFFTILIPAIFAIILFVVILMVSGYDIVEKSKEVGASLPFVSNYINDEDEEEEEEINIEEIHEELNSQEQQIEQLERVIEQKNQEIESLLSDKLQLDEELELKEEVITETQSELKEIGKTYEAMSAKNAANILAELPTNEAILHISLVNTDIRAAILAKMEPEKAAEILSVLANQ